MSRECRRLDTTFPRHDAAILASQDLGLSLEEMRSKPVGLSKARRWVYHPKQVAGEKAFVAEFRRRRHGAARAIHSQMAKDFDRDLLNRIPPREPTRTTGMAELLESERFPAPERDGQTRWSTFLKAHWECLTATDLLSVEVHTFKGLVTYILFFIDVASRSVHIAGITPHPDNRWMKQIARNVTDTEDGFLRGTRYLILDRDTKYSDEFRNALAREGIHLIRLPPRSPNELFDICTHVR